MRAIKHFSSYWNTYRNVNCEIQLMTIFDAMENISKLNRLLNHIFWFNWLKSVWRWFCNSIKFDEQSPQIPRWSINCWQNISPVIKWLNFYEFNFWWCWFVGRSQIRHPLCVGDNFAQSCPRLGLAFFCNFKLACIFFWVHVCVCTLYSVVLYG